MTEDRFEQQRKTKKEVSAGGIVYRVGDGPASAKDSAGKRVFVLMIMPAKRAEFKDDRFVPAWTFPKGWVGDHGQETLEQTAAREVREEGGVNARLVTKLGEIEYFLKLKGETVFKTVHHYLFEYADGDTADHDKEVSEARWFEINEAATQLKYDGDKQMLAKAKEFLASN
jgi:8-oxo-dGTP pyrophosphatase MutT (NUDIX family)